MQKIYNINALPTTIRIGMQTENGVESIGFDATEWVALWPDMELSVWVCAPGSEEMYESVSRREGAIIWWDVSGEDTAKDGTGAVTILGTTQDGKRKLSKQAETKIRYSGMQYTGEPPQSQQPWYVSAIDAARRAEEAAERAEAAGSGGGTGEAGKDGFSPIVDLKETQGGVIISITDEEGAKSAFVQNGKDGTDATVTTESIKTALGYIPAKTSAVDVLGVEVRNLNTKIVETQASIPPIDTTLKKSYEAADAMTVGNRFAALSEDVAKQQTALEGKADKEGEYELIETVNIDSEVKAVTRNFAATYKNIVVKGRVPKAGADGNMFFDARFRDKTVNVAFILGAINTKYERTFIAKIAKENGYWFSYTTNPDTADNRLMLGYDVVGRQFVRSENIGVNTLYWNTGATIPSGSVFEIWGVRA